MMYRLKFLPLLCFLALLWGSCSKDATTGNTAGNAGQGGSLARFTYADGYLYMVDRQNLHTYKIDAAGNPEFKSVIAINDEVETIYAYNNYLFIGSQNAMYIYRLTNPDKPSYAGTANHTRACDPVVVRGNIAYVTVRSGVSCGGTVNALMVYNVMNIFSPSLLKTIDMESPIGLGYQDERLYVCNGAHGLSVFNIGVGADPFLIKTITGENMKDVIIKDDLLIVMLEKGIALYTIGANDVITQVAKISG